MRKRLIEALEAARSSRGLLQQEVARLVGISPQSLSGYKQGLASPPLKVAYELERVLGVPITELFPREDEAEAPPLVPESSVAP